MRNLTISIVSHGHGELVQLLLVDIKQYAPAARVIVTFNIPEPDFDVAAWPGVIFRNNPVRMGFGANHNAALRPADTEWLAIVNPDIRLTTSSMAGLANAIGSQPDVAMFAPRVVGPDGKLQDAARALPTPSRVMRRAAARLLGREPEPDPPGAATWFAGMFLVVRRDAFAAVGGFDERFFLYGEDVALSVDLVARGYRIRRIDAAIVIHDARRVTLRSLQHLRWHAGSLLRLWISPAFYRHERRIAALNRS